MSDNLAICHAKTIYETVQIINVYILGNKREANEFKNIGGYLMSLKSSDNITILVDFNAHIG